jgi:hypothetical protein
VAEDRPVDSVPAVRRLEKPCAAFEGSGEVKCQA